MELLKNIKWPEPGKYVLAVSGGVDSMGLLAILAKRPGLELFVVYVDHGWRDSSAEWALVQAVSQRHGLTCTKTELKLKGRSEAEAREGRYRALETQMNAVSADGIITAQHRDDVIETLILNVLRGTGRRGLSPMAEEAGVIRPLLGIGKSELVEYARGRGLKWIEDPTNQDLRYRRNWVRHKLLPELRGQDPKFDDKLLEIIAEAEKLNRNVNKKLISLVHYKEEPKEISVDGNLVQTLDVNVLQELLIQMLITLSPGMQVDRRTIEHLAIDLKCGRLNGQRQLTGRLFAQAARDKVAIAFKAP